MDKTLKYKIEQFKKALDGLQDVLKMEKNDIVRDSTIKRFEYCHEICWKLLKVFLRQKFGEDNLSSKACFRSLGKNSIISDGEVETLLQMTDDRNEIVHTYSENFSNSLYKDIAKKYYPLLDKIFVLLK